MLTIILVQSDDGNPHVATHNIICGYLWATVLCLAVELFETVQFKATIID